MTIPYAILPSSTYQCDAHVDEDGNTTTVDRSILNVFENKHYEWKNMFNDLSGSWCVGSSNGWLLILDNDAKPLLLNPFSATTIHLPPFPYEFIHPVSHSYFVEFLRKKFILKTALMRSSSDDHILAIIYGIDGKLALCKNQKWVEIYEANKLSYCDIVFFNDCLYALAQDCSIEAWDIREQSPRRVLSVKPTMAIDVEEERKFPRNMFSRQIYLVVSKGEILLIQRYIGNFVNHDGMVVDEEYLLSPDNTQPLICPYRTKHFDVYKLDYLKMKWESVKSLHDQVLFLGANESISISVKGLKNCEGNSIYFTDDRWNEMSLDYSYGGHDWGIFNLKDMSIRVLSEYKYNYEYECKVDPPPIWAIPSLDSCHNLPLSSSSSLYCIE